MRPAPACAPSLPLVLSIFLLSILSLTSARAQSTITASRSAEISAFGELSVLHAGYCTPCNNTGLVLGADYTHFSRRFLNPALELRGSLAPGSPVGENSLGVGLRLSRDLDRLRPFANILVGVGTIHYNPPFLYADGTTYSHDNSAVFHLGGGFQYTVRPDWAFQAEFQAQRWNLGSTTPVVFYPLAVNFGVVYRIPFRSYRGR